MAASDNETLKENKQETEPNAPEQNGKGEGEGVEEKSEKEKNKSGIGKEESIDSPKTPVSRPTRERKTVERYSHTLGALVSTSKPLSIEKGRGIQLKDIPNVAYKLSKRKPDDNLQILHSILYGKKTKAQNLKKNIGQFSGYVWVENEEKNRSKVKEKIDKCVREKLLVFFDILNIPVSRSAAKKDELSVKLLDFLESPHSTTDSLLADKERISKKLKRKGKTSKSTGSLGKAARNSAKKHKKLEVGEKRKQSPKVEEDEDDEPSNAENEYGENNDNEEAYELGSDQEESGSEEGDHKSKKLKRKGTTSKGTGSLDKTAGKSATKQKKSDVGEKCKKSLNVEEDDDDEPSNTKDVSEEDTVEEVHEVGSDQEESRSEKGEGEEEEKAKKKKSKEDMSSMRIPKDSGKKATEKPKAVKKDSHAKSSKSLTKSSTASKRGSSGADSLAKPKKQKVEKKSKEDNESVKENTSTKKQSTKSPAKVSEKGGKGKSGKKAKAEPNKEEIHAAAVNILKEVDFNSATLSDIIRQLGSHFGVDLMHKKAEVKAIIADVLDNMSDEEEGDDPETGDEEEKTQDDNTDE